MFINLLELKGLTSHFLQCIGPQAGNLSLRVKVLTGPWPVTCYTQGTLSKSCSSRPAITVLL